MKIFVFSIGEQTTELAIDLLDKYGFDVEIIYNETSSLWDKLKYFYTKALEAGDEYIMRMDADIIPNENVKRLAEEDGGWVCATGYDWYKQDVGAISIHKMHRDVIVECLDHIDEAKNKDRPETYLWRLSNVNPLTRNQFDYACGLHGYGQRDQRQRIKDLKLMRGQVYNWDLIDEIESL
jgi:hypothetical protein